ncbi:D-alanine--D-alanine ligase [Pectinatus brassicae]|uniref:D-alanine--D-alanine ligase n=1 Tax=Pectinatus brassicae TaxID=862415 RepID=A0A840UP17_9FIRM|nr:D-alanine--D-alanine ligase [Pectinatus brassicae]MBB5335952.1 D-alanine-D-alanine ligase [Pectinatus brassicae]
MKYKKIAVVMGGPSSEAEISRKTAEAVINALQSKNYEVNAIELNPQTIVDDVKKSQCDIVFNAVHGKYGEDGVLQAVMQMINMPCTGSDVLASALTMNKAASKRIFLSAGISTPKTMFFKKIDDEKFDIKQQIMDGFDLPVVVKSVDQGSSIGVFTAKTEQELAEGINEAFKYSQEIIVEEFIKGRELTVAVYGNKEKRPMSIIEIVAENGVYDYHNKYTKGCSHHIIPAPLSEKLTREIQKLSVEACEITNCTGVARVDLMLSEDDIPYVLEINTVPGMTETSLVPDVARHDGIEFADLCEMMLEMVEK